MVFIGPVAELHSGYLPDSLRILISEPAVR